MFDGGYANTLLDRDEIEVEDVAEGIGVRNGVSAPEPDLPVTGVSEPTGSTAISGLDLLAVVEAEIADIAGHLNALYGRLVEVAGVVVDHDLWHGIGYRNAAHWLGMRAGLAPERARSVIAAAERRDELPATLGALSEGRLSVDQIMPIVRRVPGWAEASVSEFALYATVSQIRSVVTRYPFDNSAPEPTPPERSDPVADDTGRDQPDGDTGIESPDDPPAPQPCHEYLSLVAELDGSWSLRGRLDADRGLELDAALRAAGDALRREFRADRDSDDGHRADGAVEIEWSLVDAFAEVVRRSLSVDDDAVRRDRFRVYLHVDADGSVADPWHRLLPEPIARHITCAADIRPVLFEGGIPIQVGRSRRRVDPDLRRMILWRDKGCGVPGCGVHHRLDVHHIEHWLDGGPTDTSNLIALCPAHHRMIHRGELSMSGDADHPESLQFWNRHGRAFGASPPRRPTSPPPAPAATYVRPTGESYQSWSICFGIPPEHLT